MRPGDRLLGGTDTTSDQDPDLLASFFSEVRVNIERREHELQDDQVEEALVEAFAHLGERAPKDAAEIAELSVWALKKALHVAEIDTALMEDITFAFINGLYMKLQGGE